MARNLLVGGVVYLALSVSGMAQENAGARAYDRLATLQGEWEGTFEWSGGNNASGRVRASYRVISNSSAVLEHLIMGDGTVPSMTSLYHLDGADLRMTHYCAAMNQPRLKATLIDEAAGVTQFSFVDGTNLAARPAHVEAVEMRFPSPDRLIIRFTFVAGERRSIEHIELKRVSDAADPE